MALTLALAVHSGMSGRKRTTDRRLVTQGIAVLVVGLVLTVVIAAEGTPSGRPSPGPSPGGLAYLVVVCGLLGLPMLGLYFRARRSRSAAG